MEKSEITISLLLFAMFLFLWLILDNDYRIICDGYMCKVASTYPMTNISKKIVPQFHQDNIEKYEISGIKHEVVRRRHRTYHTDYNLTVFLKNGEIVNTQVATRNYNKIENFAEKMLQGRKSALTGCRR